MKTKKLFSIALAFTLSFFVSTAFGQVSVIADTVTVQHSVCLNSTWIKVMNLKISNKYTGTADSLYCRFLRISENSSPQTLPDSIALFKDGKKISSGSFLNNNLSIPVNKWIQPGSSINVLMYCKTFTVSAESSMILYVNGVDYTMGSYDYSDWFNRQSDWFYSRDCTLPDFDINTEKFFGSKCYNLGDTVYAFSVDMWNPNKDSAFSNGIDFLFDDGYGYANVDSVYAYDGKKLLAKGKVTNRQFSLAFKKYLPGLTTSHIKLYAKTTSYGQLVVRIWRCNWLYKGKSKETQKDVSGPYDQLQNCFPQIHLSVSTNTNSKTVCSRDRVGVSSNLTFSVYNARKVEYYANKKLFAVDSGFTDPNWFPYHENIKTIVGKTTFIVKVTDMSGRTGYDSMTLTVLPSPELKVSAPSTKLCAGDYVVFTSDTVGLAKWSWEYEELSNQTKTIFEIFDGGRHYFSGIAKNGCRTDTGILVYKVPAQDIPKVIINDWIINSSVTADSFVWTQYDQTTKSSTTIKNSNKMFMSGLPKGYYAVRAFNKYGCSEISDIVWYPGFEAKDSLPHVKLLVSKKLPGVDICNNEIAFATRKTLETIWPITKEEWFQNGNKLYFDKSQMFDGMQYKIPLNGNKITLVVKVTDSHGKSASDTATLIILGSPKIKITGTGTEMCQGQSVTFISDTSIFFTKWSWNGETASRKAKSKINVFDDGIQTYSVYLYNGCSADTTIKTYVYPAQERLQISSHDTMLWANTKANKIEWYRNDTLILNANGQFIKSKKTGYYSVKAYNTFGCSSLSDLVYFEYIAPKKPCSTKKLTLIYDKGPYCKDRVINFTVKETGLSISWPNQNKIGSVLQVLGPDGQYYAKTTDANGCTSYSDTIEVKSIILPNPVIAVSKCSLYADINLQQSGGLWQWYASDTLKQITQSNTYIVSHNGWWKVKFLDKSGCISNWSNPEFVDCKSASIRDLVSNKVKVYPNPFQNQLTIDSERGNDIVFINYQGQTVHKLSLQNDSEQITLEDLSAGIYFVRIFKHGDLQNQFKVLKQ